MREPCFRNRYKWSSIPRFIFNHTHLQAFVILTLLALNTTLIAWSRFASVTDYLFFVVPISGLGLLSLRALPSSISDSSVAALIMMGLSVFGMLIGGIADFGRLGLQTLIELCSPSINRTALQDTWRMVKLAPLSHGGMLLGCLAGVYTMLNKNYSTRNVKYHILWQILHAIGMFAGMFIGVIFANVLLRYEKLALGSVVVDFPLFTLTLNWLGMFVAAWLLFEIQRNIVRARTR